MIRSVRDYLTRRIDPAPNPLRITVRDVDDQLAGLRADPRWGHDQVIRLRADRLLDVRAVLARHEEQDRRDAALSRPARTAFRAVTRRPSLHGLRFRAS
ncbi:hypothetical protein QLQ12_17280 [Actinoplanes sp. NEAU-A12]|uniref:Uncharacterized protein n=1 Tax=Actinoplanes sandaracinus TaxID=3045177 RepID=A0ABT6WKV0_9ACTN|nr:hypothetical protein [Actinoplanes sandaracinus]MDI6100362.1 hypothetical protein [Actinoplanes sandaracinus]